MSTRTSPSPSRAKNDTQIIIPSLPAQTTSAPYTLTEAYQSAAISLTANGRQYTAEALDIAAEPPITSGDYHYRLTLHHDRLLVRFELDSTSRESDLASLIQALEASDAIVFYEQSIPRETLFDRLRGQPIAKPELLQVNDQRVWVYQFDDVPAARAAASAIQPGGTALAFTRPDGTVAREFVGGVGQKIAWWQWGQFIVQLGEFSSADAPTTDLISAALGTSPLHAETLSGADVQIRIANLSGADFDRVTLNVMGRETDYGALPTGSVSAYFPQNGAYRYAGITILAEGETYEFLPIDFMGETPLPSGNYTYALDVANAAVSIAHLNDDTLASDTAVLGKWYWSSAQRADGTFFTPEGSEGAQPYVEWTGELDPNQPGLTFTGFGGCNAIFGSYLPSPDLQGFVTAGTGGTEQGCEEPYMATELFLQQALSGIVYYSIDGTSLMLYLPSGESLTFAK